MMRMELLNEMSWVLGPLGLVVIVVALWRTLRKPPPPMGGGHQLDATDGYFMSEWCDGD